MTNVKYKLFYLTGNNLIELIGCAGYGMKDIFTSI